MDSHLMFKSMAINYVTAVSFIIVTTKCTASTVIKTSSIHTGNYQPVNWISFECWTKKLPRFVIFLDF